MTRLCYDRGVLETLSDKLPSDIRDEMALPSYLHRNPAVQWLLAKRMRVALAMIDLQEGEALLDFGCGAGLLFLQLPPGKGVYYGVDLLTWPCKALLHAHGRKDVTLLEAADWERCVPDGSLDCIVALEVLEHVADPISVVNTLQQKLKPLGRLIVAGPTENRLYALARRIAGFSGRYHHRNIFDIMRDVRAVGLITDKSVSLPMPGPGALFVINRFTKSC
jgi:2-polyprenyl-3-methyl-5-hydroxy-6-metoxy-1,4-benzoquinol methylase